MNNYIEKTIKTYAELSDIISKAHNSGIQFAFYLNNESELRLFSNSKELLNKVSKDIKLTPESNLHIKSARVRAAEKTPIQQAKRLVRFKKHLADKGITYNENHAKKVIKADYDYFINIFSESSKKSFRVYVKNTVKHEEKPGLFSSYGLSLNDSTIPFF